MIPRSKSEMVGMGLGACFCAFYGFVQFWGFDVTATVVAVVLGAVAACYTTRAGLESNQVTALVAEQERIQRDIEHQKAELEVARAFYDDHQDYL